MDFERLIQERQACRSYLAKEVEREKLEKIVECARLAPSACNSQPWKMYVVTGERRSLVAKSVQDLFMNKFASEAPAFIVLAEQNAQLKKGAERKFSSDYFVKYDIGQLAAYVTLTAKNLGLDSCIIGWVNQKLLKEAIGYSEDESCSLVISVGYSDNPLREKSRKKAEDVAVFL